MRWKYLIALAASCVIGAAYASIHGSSTPPPPPGTNAIISAQKWGGGLNSHQDWALNTGVHLLGTDGHGFYLQSSVDGHWHQQVSSTNMANAACDATFSVAGSCWGPYPTSGTSQAVPNLGGAIDMCGSPADATRAYAYQGGIFGGATVASSFVFVTSNLSKTNPELTRWNNTNDIAPGGAISSITQSGGVATVTTSSPHGLSGTPYVGIYNAVPAGYNGPVQITVTGASTFTYSVSSTLGSATTPGIWAQGFPNTSDTANDANRVNGKFVVCDPSQKDHVLVSTQANANCGAAAPAVCESRDGGITWAPIASSDIPVSPANANNNYIEAFDPNSGTTTVGGVSVQSGVCVYTNAGLGSIYCSESGGATTTWGSVAASTSANTSLTASGSGNSWTVTVTTAAPHGIPIGLTGQVNIAGVTPAAYNGIQDAKSVTSNTFTYTLTANPGTETVPGTWQPGPFVANSMVFGMTDHNLWVVDGAGSLWGCTITAVAPCAWKLAITEAVLQSVAIDPTTPGRVIVVDSGGNVRSCAASCLTSANWSSALTYALAPGDTGWYYNNVNGSNINAYNIAMDPINAGVVGVNMGQAYWTTTFPTSAFTYTALSFGIMHGDDNAIAGWITSGAFTSGGEDNGFCAQSIFSLPPQDCGQSKNPGLKWAQSLRVDGTNTYMVTKISSDLSSGGDWSGYSNDGFKTDYHIWNDWEATFGGNYKIASSTLCGSNGLCNASGSGNVRVTVDSTSQLTTWNNGQGDLVCSLPQQRTSVGTGVGSNLSHGVPFIDCWPVSVVSGTQFDLVGSVFNYANLIQNYNGTYTFFRQTVPRSNMGGGGNITSLPIPTATITNAVWASTSGGQTTFTVSSDLSASLSVGSPVVVTGVVNTGGSSSGAFNGTWNVVSLSSTTVVVSQAAGSSPGTYASGGSMKGKLIHVCAFDIRSSQIDPNFRVDISGVVDSINGINSIANGKWILINESKATSCFDLASSDNTGLGTLVSGGTVRAYIQPAGVIDASGTDVLVAAGNNDTNPYCSTDKGKTWADVTNPAIPKVTTTVVSGGNAGSSRFVVANNASVQQGIIQIVMDDGRWLYGTAESNLSVSSGTYNNATGDVVLTLAVSTAGITGDTILASKFTGTGAFATIGPTSGATWTTTNISTDGITVTFNAGAGLGATTITGGTFNVNTTNVVPMAVIPSTNPAFHTSVPSGHTVNPGAIQFTGSISGTTLTVPAVSQGPISVGNKVVGTGVSAGTIVQSQLTGTPGGIGTYQVNNSQTVSSEAMTGGDPNTGNVYLISHGWQASDFVNQHAAAAEISGSGARFYAVNSQFGLLSWNHCGTTVISNSQPTGGSSWQKNGASNSTLITVPNEPGHGIYTDGTSGGLINSSQIQRFCNGLNTNIDDGSHTNGIKFSAMPGTWGPKMIATGPPKPGRLYPSLIANMFYDWTASGTGTVAEGKGDYGLYVMWDDPNDGNNATNADCKTSSAQFTAHISGTTLTLDSGVTGTINIGDGILAPTASGGRADIARETVIVSQLSSTTYQITPSQTVASEPMTAGGMWHKIGTLCSTTSSSGQFTSGPSALSGSPVDYGVVYFLTQGGPCYITFQ